ncbi:MAG: bifunctional riboflavin kinase/FAD synthetase [Sulfurovum sp.]|nr:bifunctional riboflavin kinase/FAD synthetase [Sulfurovum sp.]MCB4753569.1 bifunctional riboflavin kinase/FAD synthetase [Sulfurovum sp.]MCB4754871.1 bifunctional riboflavin kinase/FAD synthetase [Sulfurovum sp.]MCB4759892.1 bifunctional riboflavin kinase/FAD synthetase [Sulfurovum sp.]MCB4761581.1 bifunctional riboflavin kinase/FAD synthetase [Sulfurovum sp.]
MIYKNNIKSITIGSFDGIHIAHQALIGRVEAVVVIERNGGYLTPGYKRTLYTSKPCYFYHFNKIHTLSPEAFISKIEEDFPALEKIVVGYDFSFGKKRVGDSMLLSKLFCKEVEVVPEVMWQGVSVHSRTIKQYLCEGNIEMVSHLLGRNYCIDGNIIHGQGIGQKKLVPTLNLKVKNYQLPREGVYATKTLIGEEWFESVTFIGNRMTTDGSFAVETHVLEKKLPVLSYGSIFILFHAFIRSNRKFDTLNALKIQIKKDIIQTKKILV